MSQTSTPAIPVLFFWSDHHSMWRPFVIAESEQGREVFPRLLEQLGLLSFVVQPVVISTADDGPLLDAELEQVAASLAPPLSLSLERAPAGALRVSSSAESSAVPVLYVWPPTVGAWSPLVVAITPTGRKLARDLGEHLAGSGVQCWLAGVDRDERSVIYETARLLAPPHGAFVDPAPDGVLDQDARAFASSH